MNVKDLLKTNFYQQAVIHQTSAEKQQVSADAALLKTELAGLRWRRLMPL